MSSVKCRSLTFNSTRRQCTRHSKLHHQNSYESSSFGGSWEPRAKQWWKITVEYIQVIQKRFKKRKGCPEWKNDITKLMKYAAYPLYLPCRDRRPFIPKEPYPVIMNYLDFDESSQDFSSSEFSLSFDNLSKCEKPKFKKPSISKRTRPLGALCITYEIR